MATVSWLLKAAESFNVSGQFQVLPLLLDLQHDLAARVSARDPPQRLACLFQRQYGLDLSVKLARVDDVTQRLQPLAVDVGGERFAGGPPFEVERAEWGYQGHHAAAIAHRIHGLVLGLAAGGVERGNFLSPGYHINFHGWLQRQSQAASGLPAS